MYSRYPNYRFKENIKIPENYSGNAFATELPSEDSPSRIERSEESAEQVTLLQGTVEDTRDVPTPAFSPLPKEDKRRRKAPFGFHFDIGRLFSGGFGFEELLIIALILLVSQNEAQDDIVLFLAILLFVT